MYSERVRLLLADIVEDSDRVVAFTGEMDVEMLAADERTLLAVERLFQRITEAVIQIGSDDMARIGTDLPIKNIRDFGNRLRHDYRNIDPALLLRTARTSLPLLRHAAARALEI
ncbi:HepT-like ribonuclease domain-containing protein [Sphingomonas sp. Tas61C01]|uniref:HepT-like ribonuclease domain-containing protein n=1 Tax=Sphingomonas sp. Tas61C01 TaxID=3458297 RepID=UPI00403E4045